jgi:hypothetical protein
MTDTGYKFESDEKRVYNVISTCVGMLVIVRLVIEKLSQVAAGAVGHTSYSRWAKYVHSHRWFRGSSALNIYTGS